MLHKIQGLPYPHNPLKYKEKAQCVEQQDHICCQGGAKNALAKLVEASS